jgi:hypothetical protein
MGVSVDANGYTLLSLRPTVATRYYVKNGGSDSNAGTNPTAPLATLAAAMGKVTAGNGDQILLAEGSTFTDFLPVVKSGFSATYPTVIASYDPADPTNEAKIGMGHQRSARPVVAGGGQLNSGLNSYVAIKGLDLNPGNVPSQFVQTIGNGTTGATDFLLIENNLLRYTGIKFTDGGDGLHTPLDQVLIIRNNSIYGTYSTDTSHIGGIYCDGNSHITIEDNVIWHTGWKIGASRDDVDTAGGPTVFNHPIYLQANCGTQTVRRNLMMDNAADGGIARGATISWYQNVAIKSPTGFGFGPGNVVDFDGQPSGTFCEASYNLSVGAVDLKTGSPRGGAYSLANLQPGSRIHHNLLIYNAATPGNADYSIATTGGTAYSHPSNQTYTEFEFNTAFHWSASGDAIVESSLPIHSFYSDNVWDNVARGYNTNSGSASFPNAYTEAALYAAAGVTDFTTLTTLASNSPENHYQRTLLTTAFAGYGMAAFQSNFTAPVLSSASGTATGSGTATISVSTNTANGRLYYVLLTTATPPNPSQIKLYTDASGTLGIRPGSMNVTSSGTQTINIAGVSSGTYFVHFVHEDKDGNKSAVAVSSSFTVSGFTLATWNAADMSATGIALGSSSAGAANVSISTSAGLSGVRATKAITAKAYWEANVDLLADGWAIGVADSTATFGSPYWGNGGLSHVVARFGTNGATTMYAADPVAKLFWYGVNGTWSNGDPASGTGGASLSTLSGSMYPAFQGDGGDKATANFGQVPYIFTAPTGFSYV